MNEPHHVPIFPEHNALHKSIVLIADDSQATKQSLTYAKSSTP